MCLQIWENMSNSRKYQGNSIKIKEINSQFGKISSNLKESQEISLNLKGILVSQVKFNYIAGRNTKISLSTRRNCLSSWGFTITKGRNAYSFG